METNRTTWYAITLTTPQRVSRLLEVSSHTLARLGTRRMSDQTNVRILNGPSGTKPNPSSTQAAPAEGQSELEVSPSGRLRG